jgi:hypothetical protein
LNIIRLDWEIPDLSDVEYEDAVEQGYNPIDEGKRRSKVAG